jgi:NADH:ubiquinone oxidoreductase subunit 5 (subunit L)/multisubunit Na+/H+ antiporter MnhA subunit
MGIVAMGMGLGVLGNCYGQPVVAMLGFGGALLHVVNHAFFKSLLFFGAGSVVHGIGTRDMEKMGGLSRKMPFTTVMFAVGAVAICGLPPLNGFIGEFLLFMAAFWYVPDVSSSVMLGVPVGVALALTGALALAGFSRAFGIVFLGEGRSSAVEHAHDCEMSMRLPMMLLVIGCVVLGLAVPLLLWLASGKLASLFCVVAVALGLICVVAILFLLRHLLLSGKTVEVGPTWDCGYAAPSARMQYTASSFSQPILLLVRHLLRVRRKFTPPRGLFPAQTAFASETPDVANERVYRPVFAALENLLARLQWMQHGRLNFYILAIVLALIALLVWKMG